jgi:starch phosphorylase
MSSKTSVATPRTPSTPEVKTLLEQYGCGPVQFTGTGDALYERHLMFDNVVDAAEVSPRERYEAAARSIRDVLSQRWLLTEQTYEQENPKRIYYLSMEFLIGRSLANNVMNLLLGPVAKRVAHDKNLDWIALLEQEPDAGLGNGGLGRLAACFLDSMATMQLPAMGYGLRYEYGIFRQTIEDGWQREQPDNWLRRPDPWGSPGRRTSWRSSSAARSRCAAAAWAWSSAGHPACSACRSIARSWAMAAGPSTRSGSGRPARPMSSTSRRSAPASS